MSFKESSITALALLFPVVFACASSLGQEAKTTPALSEAEIRTLLQDRLDPKADIGLVAAVVSPEGVRIITAGAAGAKGAPPLNGDTVFEIGSVTKAFTAAILSDMVERGEVALDDSLGKYLPAGVRVPERNGKTITLIDLVTHTSGLPTIPSNLVKEPANPYAHYTVSQLYAFLGEYQLTRDIGSRFEYSNLGAGLLGHALALKSGIGYEELVRQRVLQPLDMKDTAISLSASMKARLAVGHDREGNAVPNWDIPTLAGAGALRSTANDMAKFLQANLADSGPLSAALRRSHGKQRTTDIFDTDIGLSWLITKTPAGEIVWHNGQTGGYHSFMGLDLKNRYGVVILHNSNADIDDIGFYLLDNRLPRPIKRRVEITIKPEVLDLYPGEYRLAPGFTLTVTREEDKLFVRATGQPRFQVYPSSETEFFYKAVDAQITFVKDSTGRVTGLVLHQGGRDMEGARIR
ncbi:MAG: serine hydrolase [Candidatus Krumholzibacteria bacterium]|nr:serine hydrolase [Candidatus Krumholzibacteria bacterium]